MLQPPGDLRDAIPRWRLARSPDTSVSLEATLTHYDVPLAAEFVNLGGCVVLEKPVGRVECLYSLLRCATPVGPHAPYRLCRDAVYGLTGRKPFGNWPWPRDGLRVRPRNREASHAF